jgi:hypothetical protein
MWLWVLLVMMLGVGAGYARRTTEERAWATEAVGAAKAEFMMQHPKGTPNEGALYTSAVKWLGKLHPNHGITKPLQFIRRWYGRAVGEGDLHDAAGRGRRPKLDENNPAHKRILEQCLQELDNGYIDEEGHPQLFAGMQHAVDGNKCLKDILNDFNYTPQGLQDRLMDYDPNLKLRTQVLKPEFDDKRKAERVQVCQQLLDIFERDPMYYRRIFFLDCHQVYCKPKGGHVLCRRADDPRLTKEDWRMNKKLQDTIKLQFYVMLNWYGGICAIWFTQGTTGVVNHYRVSRGGGGGYTRPGGSQMIDVVAA